MFAEPGQTHAPPVCEVVCEVNNTMMDPALPSQVACEVQEAGEVVGYLVIDSFVKGRSHGGVRMRQDVSQEEVRLLARTMTTKYSFLGLPFGGAKAGVIGDPEAPREEKRARLSRFGRALRPLLAREIFVPAADMGTDLEDIHAMLRLAGIRLQRRRLPPVSSGTYTAHSVFACSRVLAEAAGFPISQARVAIQGFGAVGSALAGLMHAAGACVVSISTSDGAVYDPRGLDVPQLLHARRLWGSALVRQMPPSLRIERDAVLELPVEVLVPCASIHSIHEGNAHQISARVICAGANNPWTPAAEAVLEQKGVVFLPEFATNAGGVLGTVMTYAGFTREETEAFVQSSFRRTTLYLLKKMHAEGISGRAAALRLAEARRVRDEVPRRQGLPTSLITVGLWMHRRGLVPSTLTRVLSRPYFRHKMAVGLSE